MTRKAAIVFALLSGVPLAPIGAHPGRTDAQGCHNERATGHRHCHGGITAAAAPVRERGGVDYPNCAAARAAGAAPIRRGEPGYSRKLDRDGDGIACE